MIAGRTTSYFNTFLAKSTDAFPGHKTSNAEQHDNEGRANHPIDLSGAFQPLNRLGSGFDAGDRSNDHDRSQFDIDIAQSSMLTRGDDRFADDVGEIGSHHEVHRHSRGKESRAGQKTYSNAEKSAQKT